MEFLEQFQYVIKYKKGKKNVVADVLSHRNLLFSKLGAQILGFDHIHELDSQDLEFSSIFADCKKKKNRKKKIVGRLLCSPRGHIQRKKKLHSPRFTKKTPC